MKKKFKNFKKEITILNSNFTVKLHNHLENNWNLSNKKALFYNLRSYYLAQGQNPFDFIPLTFHIKNGKEDKEYTKFLEYYQKREVFCKEINKQIAKDSKFTMKKKSRPKNIWIIKPGEITNCGNGITVCQQIEEIEKNITSKEMHKYGK